MLSPTSLLPVKGHRYLIEAMSLLPQSIELWLAGEGKLEQELRKLVRELGLEKRVHFLDHLSHNILLTFYCGGQVNVVALASVDLGNGLHEGIPVSLMEAMAYKIPVISTNTGGIPELLGDGAGIIVEQKNPDELAEAIIRLINDEDLRKWIGEKGFEKVNREFNLSKIVDELLYLMKSSIC